MSKNMGDREVRLTRDKIFTKDGYYIGFRFSKSPVEHMDSHKVTDERTAKSVMRWWVALQLVNGNADKNAKLIHNIITNVHIVCLNVGLSDTDDYKADRVAHNMATYIKSNVNLANLPLDECDIDIAKKIILEYHNRFVEEQCLELRYIIAVEKGVPYKVYGSLL